jgi:hypothetical protein
MTTATTKLAVHYYTVPSSLTAGRGFGEQLQHIPGQLLGSCTVGELPVTTAPPAHEARLNVHLNC